MRQDYPLLRIEAVDHVAMIVAMTAPPPAGRENIRSHITAELLLP